MTLGAMQTRQVSLFQKVAGRNFACLVYHGDLIHDFGPRKPPGYRRSNAQAVPFGFGSE